jgi:hypothetical protein
MRREARASRVREMKRLVGWLAIVFAALVLLMSAAYVASGVHGTIVLAKAKKKAVSDLAAELPGGKVEAVRDRDQVRAAYRATWGPPEYAWQELVCELDTVDVGWIADHYTQRCRIRSVDLIPTTATSGRCSRAPLPTTAPAPAPSTTTTSTPGTNPGPGAGPPSGPGLDTRYRAVVDIGPTDAFDDHHPYRLGCPGDILEPPDFPATRMLSGSRPPSLAASPAWIVVTIDTAVSTTDLGCDPWAVLFCTEPVDRPIIGDVE